MPHHKFSFKTLKICLLILWLLSFDCSDEELQLETSALELYTVNQFTFINSFDNTKLPCYSPPLMQHHSLFWNLPSLFTGFQKDHQKGHQTYFLVKSTLNWNQGCLLEHVGLPSISVGLLWMSCAFLFFFYYFLIFFYVNPTFKPHITYIFLDNQVTFFLAYSITSNKLDNFVETIHTHNSLMSRWKRAQMSCKEPLYKKSLT